MEFPEKQLMHVDTSVLSIGLRPYSKLQEQQQDTSGVKRRYQTDVTSSSSMPLSKPLRISNHNVWVAYMLTSAREHEVISYLSRLWAQSYPLSVPLSCPQTHTVNCDVRLLQRLGVWYIEAGVPCLAD